MQDGNEDRLKEMLPDHLPEEIQRLYDLVHETAEAESWRDSASAVLQILFS